MPGILQAKKSRYALIMEGFWLGDKIRIRAVNLSLPIVRFPWIGAIVLMLFS